MRKNIKFMNILPKSDFNFRFTSKNDTFYINIIITILLILIFLILVVLFYLDYKTTQRLDSLFMNYQNLFERQLQMNLKLEEYIKEAISKNDIQVEKIPVDNSERINKLLYRIGGIITLYLIALGMGFTNELIRNPAGFNFYALFPEFGPFDPPDDGNDTRFLPGNISIQPQILPFEPENPDDDNRIILPAHDPNVTQILPAPGHAIINEGIEEIFVGEEIEINNDTE
jgi:hypothetical protein